jgi:hypothetical protein
MNRQQASVQATRDLLYALIKASPYTFKAVADLVGERNDTLSTRLRDGGRRGYQILDVALVVNILAVLGVSQPDFFVAVFELAELELGAGDYVKQVQAHALRLLRHS